MGQGSQLELLFALQLGGIGMLESCEREYVFCPPRRWRFDFAWPDRAVAVEVEGGLWQYGRHNRAAGMVADLEKYNTATLLGWRVFRFDSHAISDGEAIEWMEGVFGLTTKKEPPTPTPKSRDRGQSRR